MPDQDVPIYPRSEITQMLKEFKEFAMKGNVLDMAVGIIMGVAFGKIITSFVNDVIMPRSASCLARWISPAFS